MPANFSAAAVKGNRALAAALCDAPLGKAQHADDADWCRSLAASR